MYRIYMITGPDGRRYIGMTTKTEAQRMRQHRKDRGRFNMPILKAIADHGIEAFTIRTLAECIDRREAIACERGLIAQYGTLYSAGGYNLTRGGVGMSGYRHTAETKAKWSAQRLGKKRPPFTAEHRARMSAAHKGTKLSPSRAAKSRLTIRKAAAVRLHNLYLKRMADRDAITARFIAEQLW